jgi:2-oxoglutarate/2-oxoacid ferredoxin oxidoreductase subunit beta
MTYQKNSFEGQTPTWCSGCGDWPIRTSLIKAFTKLGLSPSSMIVSFEIGCNGNMNDFLNAYAIHGLHGRALPTAIGAKLGNHSLPVVVIGGDGATYGEGGNHFLHACRGNHDVTMLVHDNSVYGLTTGQVSPMSKKGMQSKSTPTGTIERSANPLTFALTQGATFIAQGFSGNVAELSELIEKAIAHKGFSFINILQPCVTFNKINTYHYYIKNTKKLREGYNATNKQEALQTCLALDSEEFYTGVLYHEESKAYHEQVVSLQETTLVAKKPFLDIAKLAAKFA